ncbi:MAG: hypothetical protein WCO23_03955 [bacterium]
MQTTIERIYAATEEIKNEAVTGSIDFQKIADKAYTDFISVVGVLIFIAVVYSGFLILTSAGDPAKVEKAKKLALYTLIGAFIAIFAYAIYDFFAKIVNS